MRAVLVLFALLAAGMPDAGAMPPGPLHEARVVALDQADGGGAPNAHLGVVVAAAPAPRHIGVRETWSARAALDAMRAPREPRVRPRLLSSRRVPRMRVDGPGDH